METTVGVVGVKVMRYECEQKHLVYVIYNSSIRIASQKKMVSCEIATHNNLQFGWTFSLLFFCPRGPLFIPLSRLVLRCLI